MGEKPKDPDPPDVGELYEQALQQHGFVRVRSVEGRPVTRYGTPVLIGAVRDPEKPNKLIFSPADVITIPRDEAERYRREYLRHVAEGDLVLVSDPKSSEVGAPRKPPTESVSAKGPPDASNEGRRQ